MKWRIIARLLAVIFAVAAIVVLCSSGEPDSSPPPMLPPITVTASPTASAAPTATKSAKPTKPTTTATTTSSVVMVDPVGEPIQVEVVARSGKLLVSAPLSASTPRADEEFVPPRGEANWWAAPGWPRPGVKSAYRSVIAGHVSAYGEPDVFHGLLEAREGDTVRVLYDSDTVVTFVVDKANIDVGKLSVVQDPRFDWVWESPKGTPSRVVSLFTCNPDAPHVKGSSTRNIVVQATRVS